MISMVHGNKAGTGARLDVEIKAATEDEGGSVVLIFTPQTATGEKAGEHKFDPQCAVSVWLDAVNAAKLSYVLIGGVDAVQSIRIKDGPCLIILYADEIISPFKGFALHVVRETDEGKASVRIALNASEARALALGINSAFGRVAFSY